MSVKRTAFEIRNASGGALRGDVWSGDAPTGEAAVVICHGFKGFKDWGFFPYLSEQVAARSGVPAISFNFSGSGIGADLENFTELDKFEANTFSAEIEDLGAVLDAAAVGQLPGLGRRKRFGLFGHSRGGASVILRSSKDERVAALVTWAAISSVHRWSDEQVEEWRRRGVLEVLNARTGQMMPLGLGLLEDVQDNAERLDIIGAVSGLDLPYLIIHGAEDESVSSAEGELIAQAAGDSGAEFVIIEGAGHTFGAVHPFAGATEHLTRAIDLTVDWFARHLG